MVSQKHIAFAAAAAAAANAFTCAARIAALERMLAAASANAAAARKTNIRSVAGDACMTKMSLVLRSRFACAAELTWALHAAVWRAAASACGAAVAAPDAQHGHSVLASGSRREGTVEDGRPFAKLKLVAAGSQVCK